MSRQVPIAEGLFTWPSDQPRLLGARSVETGNVVFPAPAGDEAAGYEPVELKSRGLLWSWTIQRFRPKEPYAADDTDESFKPYGVGYIELPGEVIVEARLTENDPAKLKIGMPMELEIVPFSTNEAGDEIMTFAFRPVAA